MTQAAASDDPKALLARVELIADLSAEELDALVAHAQRRRFSDGALMFLEGEECQGMQFIIQGAVRIYAGSSSGREIQLTLQRAPATIAEIPVFDSGPYPASARAVGEVVTYEVSKEAFASVVRSNPEVAIKVLAVVGRRTRQLVRTIHQVTFGTVRQRLARMLLEAEEEHEGSPFELAETHRKLAETLGTVREVVSRNLGRFQSEKLIRTEGRQVWILDRSGLRAETEAEIHR